MSAQLERVLAHPGLERLTQHGDYWTARCPAHEDHNPSLTIREAADGWVTFKCHADCKRDAILAALRLELKDIGPPLKQSKRVRSRIVETYPYVDERGELLYEVVRKDPRSFPQRRPDGKDGWIWNLDNTRRVLYRLPAVLEAVAFGHTIYIVEGEKDVAALERAGYVATCNSEGAGCWHAEFAEHFRGADVIIVADRDQKGRNHAADIAASLDGVAASVRVVEAAIGKDAAEHLGAGRTVDEFVPITLDEVLEQAVLLSEPIEEASTAETAAFDDYTDLGNARLLVAEHGDRFRYVKRFGEFLVWTGTHWAEDQTGEIERLAKATVDGLLPRIPVEPDGEKRKKLTTHYARSRDDRKLTAMVKVARTEPGIAVLADQLDRDQWLLNVSNGTVDLRTGQIHLHDPDELHTKVAPVEFLSDAACPTWLRFLDDIFLSDAALIEFVQRAVGYSLTGSVSEQVLFFLYGGGSNGKTTFTRAIGDLLGTSNGYAKTIDPSLLMRTNHEQHPTGLTDLRGTRFAITSETGEGKRLDEELIKRLTGGDKITARRMRQDFFEFEPTHKIWLYGNHRPSIQGTDFAIWRRLLLVPFDREFSELEKDGDMPERLAAERSGILTWAVEGCLAWQSARSLGVPDRVRASTQQYRSSEDHVGRFLEDCCTILPGLEITASDLRAVYVAWAQEQGERPWSEHKLAPRFEERGFKKVRAGHHNTRTWFGFTANGVDSQLGLATVKPPSDQEPF